jgi:hypothetical protein
MSKKKFILLTVLTQSILFFNCKKDPVAPDPAPQYMTDLLTEDSLQFASYIIKWNSSKADTFYQRGARNNKWSLDTSWLKFNKDGTYKGYMPQGYNYSADWQFLEKGAKLRLRGSGFDQQLTLLKLTKDTVEWLNPALDSLFYRLVRK